MNRLMRWIPIAALALVLGAPMAVQAQRPGGQRPSREQIEQRVRAQMGRMMQERLGLDQEEAGRLSEVVQSFEGRRRELATREFETRRRVEALLEAGGDEDEARALLELQAQLRLEEAELFRAEQAALLQVLSPEQVLELQDLRSDLGRRIRALRGGGRGRADRPRGPGPDGRLGWSPRPGGGPPS